VTWARRLAIAGIALVVILLAGAGALVLTHHQQSQSKIDDVAARACRYPTDAAGRRYVSREVATTGVNYIQTLQAMYHRCPNRGVATPRPQRRRSTGRVFAGHRHPTTTQGSGERGDGEDDGGD
jgi:hypothetical protein